jgi:hypothetical protein
MNGNSNFYEVELPNQKSKQLRNVNITTNLRDRCI